MTLSKTQTEYEKVRFRKWFWIWERDMLELARRFPNWRVTANRLGFRDEKINTPWAFADAGRQIQYMENPYYEKA